MKKKPFVWIGIIVGGIVFGLVFRSVANLSSGNDKEGLSLEQKKILVSTESSDTPNKTQQISDTITSKFNIPTRSKGEFPLSLLNTSIDGHLKVDENNRFIADSGARRLFDYFLSATGEESEEVIRGRIIWHAIQQGLPESVVEDITAALGQYLLFRHEAKVLAKLTVWHPDDFKSKAESFHDLQLQIMGIELADAFFGEENLITLLDIERRAVLNNPDLSDLEKQRLAANINAQLPKQTQIARKDAVKPSKINRRVQGMREQGANEKSIFAMREEAFGTDAAKRLTRLDAQRADWGRKLNEFSRAQQDLLAQSNDTTDIRYQEELETLYSKFFTELEIKRVKALY